MASAFLRSCCAPLRSQALVGNGLARRAVRLYTMCSSCSPAEIHSQRDTMLTNAVRDKDARHYISVQNMNRVLDVSSHFDLRQTCRTAYYDDIAEDLEPSDFFVSPRTATDALLVDNFRPHRAIMTHRSSFLNKFCIIENVEQEIAKAGLTDKIAKKALTPLEDRALGAVLGMVIGDAFGSPYEYTLPPHRNVATTNLVNMEHYGLLAGQWTDAGSLGLCVLDSLLSTDKSQDIDLVDMMVRVFNWWYFGYNNSSGFVSDSQRKPGIDGSSVAIDPEVHLAIQHFLEWGSPRAPGMEETAPEHGATSVCRVAPVAVRFHADLERAREVSRRQSLPTHHTARASLCSELLCEALLTAFASKTPSAKSVIDQAMSSFKFDATSSSGRLAGDAMSQLIRGIGHLNWRSAPPPVLPRFNILQCQEGAIECLATALHCVWTTTSFEEALQKAAQVASDPSTVGSITGQLAGAIYGASAIPSAWLNAVQQWDHGGSIALRAHRLLSQ